MLVFILYTAFVIPIRIPFENNPHMFFVIFDVTMDFLFGVDILVNFFLAYENEDGEFVINRRKICINYLKGWLLLDIMSSVPFTLIGKFTQNEVNANLKYVKLSRLPRLYRLLRLMKLVRLHKSSKFLEFIMNKMKIGIEARLKIKIFAMLFLLIHLVGCCWAIAVSKSL
jgi:hypothetical protein